MRKDLRLIRNRPVTGWKMACCLLFAPISAFPLLGPEAPVKLGRSRFAGAG
jgi:hypothetical protein